MFSELGTNFIARVVYNTKQVNHRITIAIEDIAKYPAVLRARKNQMGGVNPIE